MRTPPEISTRIAPIACTLALAIWGAGCAQRPGWASFEWPEASVETLALQEDLVADLPAPESLRAVSGELRLVPLTWEPLLLGDVGGYVVERAPSREGPFETLAQLSGRLATTYVDRDTAPVPPPVSAAPSGNQVAEVHPPLKDGISWFYRVRAFSQAGGLAPAASPVVAATTAPSPDPPQDLRAYSRQPRMVPLSWRAAEDPNVVGYQVARSPTSRGPFELLAEVDGRYQTSLVDRGLGDLRVFYYRIVAVNTAGGIGEASSPVRAVTKPEPLPPMNLRVIKQQLGINQLAWDPNVEEDIVEYRLLRTRAGSDAPAHFATLSVDETTAVDSQVGAGERLFYTVVAVDRDGLTSGTAQAVEVESESYGLSATAGPDGVRLEWNPRSEEGFHGAHVTRTTPFRQRKFGRQAGSQFHDPDVAAESTHRYVVVLERPDRSLAPPSPTVEISIPTAGAD